LKKETKIFLEGEKAYIFYIIFNGQIIEKKEMKITILNSGDFFGEEGLLENMERNITIKTKSNSILLCLLGENFRNAIEALNYQKLKERIEIIKKIFIFSKKKKFILKNK
jgi:CRP-like cAMP-binding protein